MGGGSHQGKLLTAVYFYIGIYFFHFFLILVLPFYGKRILHPGKFDHGKRER